ncbi:hypothetical protein DFH27DRAFT_277501 [Peziza echinospora]|nr:hypothetical protein DFH27DRAFT_277501 [Peziza echinospora]
MATTATNTTIRRVPVGNQGQLVFVTTSYYSASTPNKRYSPYYGMAYNQRTEMRRASSAVHEHPSAPPPPYSPPHGNANATQVQHTQVRSRSLNRDSTSTQSSGSQLESKRLNYYHKQSHTAEIETYYYCPHPECTRSAAKAARPQSGGLKGFAGLRKHLTIVSGHGKKFDKVTQSLEGWLQQNYPLYFKEKRENDERVDTQVQATRAA